MGQEQLPRDTEQLAQLQPASGIPIRLWRDAQLKAHRSIDLERICCMGPCGRLVGSLLLIVRGIDQEELDELDGPLQDRIDELKKYVCLDCQAEHGAAATRLRSPS